MSTTINVTVDDGGLPAKNRQQTTANRQAFVQGRASQQAAQQGVDQRAADRRAAGLDPTTGRPLASAGASSRMKRIDQEPAANRKGDEFFLLRPDTAPLNDRIQLTHRGLISFASRTGGVITYSANEGPNNSPALIAENTPRGNYVGITGRFPFEGSTSRFKEGVRDFTFQYYVKFGGPFGYLYDGVDIVVRLGSKGFVDIIAGLTSRVGDELFAQVTMAVKEDIGKPTTELIDSSEPIGSGNGPPLTPGEWHHLAVSKQGSNLYAFFDGQLVGSAVVSWTTMVFQSTPASEWLKIEYGVNSVQSIASAPVYLHGLRFDPKALYTDNFTPPPSI